MRWTKVVENVRFESEEKENPPAPQNLSTGKQNSQNLANQKGEPQPNPRSTRRRTTASQNRQLGKENYQPRICQLERRTNSPESANLKEIQWQPRICQLGKQNHNSPESVNWWRTHSPESGSQPERENQQPRICQLENPHPNRSPALASYSSPTASFPCTEKLQAQERMEEISLNLNERSPLPP
ncbi:hypothetical protein AVEN_251196-1 [Araneus ventricosus]|uniref:Uncharacterized protein n=1 Tax=Araneus ventricosus TaxID=182803 RepID=A0A4Y2TP60_ARAVE|nr:hypothetical protein AVEN_251196-1 [Araneus ventricosus]